MRTAILALSLSACASGLTDPDDMEDPGVDARSCPAVRKVAESCGALLDEPFFLTMIDQASGLPNEVAILGANSGNTCTIARFPASNDIEYVTSLAAIGTDIFYCAATATDATGLLTRVSLIDGLVTTSGLRCHSVTAFDEKLVVMTDVGPTQKLFDHFDAVLAGTSSPMTVGECAIRMGAGDDNKLYSTWPSPSQIYVFDPSTSAANQLAMASSTISVVGIAAQRGHVAILDGSMANQYLHSFDATTGAPAARVVASTQVARVHGLSNACSVPVLE